MADVLGIASEEAYPYKGVSDYCHSDIPHAAKFANVRRATLFTLHGLPWTSAVTSFWQRSARVRWYSWHAGVSAHPHCSVNSGKQVEADVVLTCYLLASTQAMLLCVLLCVC